VKAASREGSLALRFDSAMMRQTSRDGIGIGSRQLLLPTTTM